MRSKNIVRVLALCAVTTAMLSACGSSKSSQASAGGGSPSRHSQSSAYGTKQEETECQRLAEEKPATRAFGDATNHSLSYAKTYAAGRARAELALAVKGKITAATHEANINFEKYAGSDTEGSSISDQGSKQDLMIQQIAEETIENSVVIKTETYIQPNRQYHVFVCVEYQGDATKMANTIVDKVKQRIPDEDRIKMEYNFQKFEEKIKQELESQGK